MNHSDDSRSRDADMRQRQRNPGASECDGSRRNRWPGLRLGPITMIGITALGLTVAFGLNNNWFVLGRHEPATRSPGEVADSLLQRLLRSQVTERLAREPRLDSASPGKPMTVADELARLRTNPVYETIRTMMTEHLHDTGYDDRIPIIHTQSSIVIVSAVDAEISLTEFSDSMRVVFPAPNEKVAAYLRDQEQAHGSSVVAHRDAGHYDATLYFLIKLLGEFPDDLATVARDFSWHHSTP